MTSPTQSRTTPAARRDGWTAQRRDDFLDALSVGSDVSRACARVGLSRQAAYRLRRRDAGFAAAWDEALRAACAEGERSFIALLVERCPWARSVFPDACEAQGRAFLPQDSVTTGPCA